MVLELTRSVSKKVMEHGMIQIPVNEPDLSVREIQKTVRG